MLVRGKKVEVDEVVRYGTPRFVELFKHLAAEHGQAALALGRGALLRVGGETVQRERPAPERGT